MKYFDTMTNFKENSKMKKLRQDWLKKNGLEEGMFIRKCVYEKIGIADLADKK